MTSTIKTHVSDDSVEDFINSVEDPIKRQDSFTLLEIYTRVTGEKPRMWGSSIIGFGQYHYKSERSRQEGDWPLAGFSPRKQNLSLYINFYLNTYDEDLKMLGKHKSAKGCLYIKKLADVDLDVLENLIVQSYQDAKTHLQ